MIAISFPHLNPVAITFFGFDIYWYSLAYVFGIGFGYVLIKKFNRRYHVIFSPAAMDDLIVYSVLSIMLGGRIGFVFIYNFADTISNPLNIFMLRKGGMSIHGAMIGLIFAAILLSRKHKINFFSAMDMFCCVAPIGIFLGRIANFVNGELYGRVSDVPWAVIFSTGGNIPRHPSQLYEAAAEGLMLFGLMMFLFYRTKSFKKPGTLAGFFSLFYGLARIIIENFREPDAKLGYFFGSVTMGQILSIPLLLVGIYFIIRKPKALTCN